MHIFSNIWELKVNQEPNFRRTQMITYLKVTNNKLKSFLFKIAESFNRFMWDNPHPSADMSTYLFSPNVDTIPLYTYIGPSVKVEIFIILELLSLGK